ncbi:MAG TPA: hypothetical protein VNZ85_03730 [Caulobacter sp.]|nr:hypothetical protein [Caulobacter sp.]
MPRSPERPIAQMATDATASNGMKAPGKTKGRFAAPVAPKALMVRVSP